MKFLTNIRPTKDLGTELIVSCSKGQLKLSPDAADILGVEVGPATPKGVERRADYVTVAQLKDDSYVIAKGTAETLGNKLGSANDTGGGSLTFSSAAAWEGLNGDEDFNTVYEVGSTPVTGEEAEEAAEAGFILYPLTFKEKIAKPERKKSTKSESSDTVEDETIRNVENVEANDASDSFGDM